MAELAAAYPGVTEDWYVMPLRRLAAYADNLGHVRAIASFHQSEAVAVGSGALKESGRRSAVDRWRSDLRRRADRTAKDPAALAAAATASGIGFVRVVPGGDGAPAAPDPSGVSPSTTP